MTGSGATHLPLELDDIQSGALHSRPTPYAAHYTVLRIDDGAAGRQMLRRLLPVVGTMSLGPDRDRQAWVSVGFSFQGLKALGVPQDTLDSFPGEFRQGMAARAARLGDT